jgi:F-type H+-transporting ATPase subunit a
VEHPPTIYLALADRIPEPLQALALSTLLTALFALLIGRAVRGGDLVPEPGLTPRNLIEVIWEGIAGLMRDVIGPTWPRYVPLVGTLGFFILVSNLMGMVPGLGGSTNFVETNLAWAVMAFLVSEYAALRHQGVRIYFSHLAGPVLLLAPLIFTVEVIGHAARMFSLTVRLTGNLFADHTLIAVFLSLPVVAFLVPWAFMGLGLFVAFLQAFIFTFLTITYIGQALEDAHH